jgi:hypothetical protein
LPIGTGFKSLMKTYKKVLRGNMKKWIIYKLLSLSRPYKYYRTIKNPLFSI